MAITRTQFNNAQSGASGPTIAVALTGIAAGSLVIVIGSCESTKTMTLADDLSVAGVSAVAKTGVAKRQEILYYKNYGGGDRTFTLTFNTNSSLRSIVAIEYAGADTVDGLDAGKTSSSNGEDANPTSGAVTPSVNGALFVGSCGGNANQPAAASPFGVIYNNTVNLLNSEDYIQTTAASQAAPWTITSDFWAACVAVFKPAAGGGGGAIPVIADNSYRQRRAA